MEVKTIGRWERGSEEIPDEYAAHLMEIFGVSAPFLLGRNDEDAAPLSVADRVKRDRALRKLAHCMGETILELPADCEWRDTFMRIRRILLDSAGGVD